MNLYLLKEVRLFSLSIVYGIGILLFYDCFRILRRLIPHNAVAIAFQDLFFWIVTGFSIFALLYRYNNGSIRAYCILGMGIGMIFYGMAISPFFMALMLKIGESLKKILRKCKKSFIILHKKSGRLFGKKGRLLFRRVKKFLYGK